MKDDMKLEMQAGSNIQLDHIKEIMKENIHDLLAENKRLKAQLDREIHINRIMKKALEVYADNINWGVDLHSNKYKKWLKPEDGFKLAQQTLKEIEEME